MSEIVVPSVSNKIGLDYSKDKILISQQRSTTNIIDNNEQQNRYLIHLISVFNQSSRRIEFLIKLDECLDSIDGKLIGQTVILTGPSQAGKLSSILWIVRNQPEIKKIIIDCNIYKTQIHFIKKMANDIGQQINIANFSKKINVNGNYVKFAQLNQEIIQSQVKFIIIIKNSQRLVQYRKQLLLYNLLEWLKTDIKQCIGLIFLVKSLTFINNFEKRVKSRLSAKSILLCRPKANIILNLLGKRVQFLLNNKKQRLEDQINFEKINNINNLTQLQFYQIIYNAIINNKKLQKIIQKYQQITQKDLVFYLNSMKMAISIGFTNKILSFLTNQQIINQILIQSIQSAFQYLNPSIYKNLLISTITLLFIDASLPQHMIMSILRYMDINNRHPFRLKTIFQIYKQMKQRHLDSQGIGSSFIFSKNIFQHSLWRLIDMKILLIQCKDTTIWMSQIKTCMYPNDILSCFEEIDNVPNFINIILHNS